MGQGDQMGYVDWIGQSHKMCQGDQIGRGTGLVRLTGLVRVTGFVRVTGCVRITGWIRATDSWQAKMFLCKLKVKKMAEGILCHIILHLMIWLNTPYEETITVYLVRMHLYRWQWWRFPICRKNHRGATQTVWLLQLMTSSHSSSAISTVCGYVESSEWVWYIKLAGRQAFLGVVWLCMAVTIYYVDVLHSRQKIQETQPKLFWRRLSSSVYVTTKIREVRNLRYFLPIFIHGVIVFGSSHTLELNIDYTSSCYASLQIILFRSTDVVFMSCVICILNRNGNFVADRWHIF